MNVQCIYKGSMLYIKIGLGTTHIPLMKIDVWNPSPSWVRQNQKIQTQRPWFSENAGDNSFCAP